MKKVMNNSNLLLPALAKIKAAKPLPVWQYLCNSPHHFNFFQAVHIIEWLSCREHNSSLFKDKQLFDALDPKHEIVRFCSLPSLSFPLAAVHTLELINAAERTAFALPPLKMTVTFMGLFGQAGVLPSHYTELIIERAQYKDYSLRDFLDIFNHLAITWFYRAWKKHRADLAYCYKQYTKDKFTHKLACCIGQGTPHLAKRLSVADDIFIYYGGWLANHRLAKSSVAMRSILTEYFQVPVRLQSFCERRVYIPPVQQTRLLQPASGSHHYNILGNNAVVGAYVWENSSTFRICLGPLCYAEFISFLPGKARLKQLTDIIARLTNRIYQVQLQLVVKAGAVPACHIGKRCMRALGWNTWLKSQPFKYDANDAIIALNFVI